MVTETQALDIFDGHFVVDHGDRTFNHKTQAVDVMGDLYVKSTIKSMPQIPIKLGVVQGYARIKNVKLQSLTNAPTRVTESMNVSDNLLTSLAGASTWVGKDLWVDNNRLMTLHAPDITVSRDLLLRGNNLQDLQGCPHVGEALNVDHNPLLTDLSGLTNNIKHLFISYNSHLPLLRLLLIQGELILRDVPDQPWEETLSQVFRDPRYKGQGKHVMLNVALILRKAGVPASNIRW